MHKRKTITVFEHESIRLNQKFDGDIVFDQNNLNGFQRFYGNGLPYFDLIHNGIRFNQFVGVIQVGETVVEVLPKADKNSISNEVETKWREVLIQMLQFVHGFEIHAPSSSSLKIKQNSILDLYFELFIKEVEYLLHKGLVKKYRKKIGNQKALKGSLQFSQHINHNLIHKERFYVQHTTYDTRHVINIILHQTLLVLQTLNTSPRLSSRINKLLLNFPEMPIKRITESTFNKIVLNRKTSDYKRAIDIARLILLRYHPNLSNGRANVLALMFDMNSLWEQFVLKCLKEQQDFCVKGQQSKNLWKPEYGNKRTLRPDILILTKGKNYILDTKWKLVDNKPSIEDIRQMYSYLHYFKAEKTALLYPGSQSYFSGNFMDVEKNYLPSKLECGLLFTEVTQEGSLNQWKNKIINDVKKWLETDTSN